MQTFRRLAWCAFLLSACGRSAGIQDIDLGAADLSVLDGAIAVDLTAPVDLALLPDLASADLASPDLARAPDLSSPPFSIAPSSYVVPIGRSQIFVAAGAQTWSLVEAGGGALVAAGDVGTYTAPLTPGVYHLQASDGATTATATITVADFELSVIAGIPGGGGELDGIGSEARFSGIFGVAYDGAGTFYLADTLGQTIRKLVLATAEVTTLAGTPKTAGFADGIGTQAQFRRPGGIAYDGAGTLYVVDRENYALRRVDVATGEVTTVASQLAGPTEVVYDGAGTLYLADGGMLRAFDTTTQMLSTITSPFSVTSMAYDNGAIYYTNLTQVKRYDLTSGQTTVVSAPTPLFNNLRGMGPDGQGGILVADRTYDRVYRVSLADGSATEVLDCSASPYICNAWCGTVVGGTFYLCDGNALRAIDLATKSWSYVAGSNEAIGFADGPALSATFMLPLAVTVDGAGTVYVSDELTIRRFSPGSGAIVDTLAGYALNAVPEDGLGSSAHFRGIVSLAVEPSGGLLAGDITSIRHVTSDGLVTTPYGAWLSSGYVDAAGPASRFGYTAGVVAVGGKYYISDPGNGAIRVIDPTTQEVSTFLSIAGGRALTSDGEGRLFLGLWPGGAIVSIDLATKAVQPIAGDADELAYVDAIGDAARFGAFGGLAWDGAGTLYVADGANGLIRRVYVPTRAVSTFAGQARVQAVRLGSVTRALLNHPDGVAHTPAGALVISMSGEPAILQLTQK